MEQKGLSLSQLIDTIRLDFGDAETKSIRLHKFLRTTEDISLEHANMTIQTEFVNRYIDLSLVVEGDELFSDKELMKNWYVQGEEVASESSLQTGYTIAQFKKDRPSLRYAFASQGTQKKRIISSDGQLPHEKYVTMALDFSTLDNTDRRPHIGVTGDDAFRGSINKLRDDLSLDAYIVMFDGEDYNTLHKHFPKVFKDMFDDSDFSVNLPVSKKELAMYEAVLGKTIVPKQRQIIVPADQYDPSSYIEKQVKYIDVDDDFAQEEYLIGLELLSQAEVDESYISQDLDMKKNICSLYSGFECS